jgi:hypothetical protein
MYNAGYGIGQGAGLLTVAIVRAVHHHSAKSEQDKLVKGNIKFCLKNPTTGWCSDYMTRIIGGDDGAKYVKVLAKAQSH